MTHFSITFPGIYIDKAIQEIYLSKKNRSLFLLNRFIVNRYLSARLGQMKKNENPEQILNYFLETIS